VTNVVSLSDQRSPWDIEIPPGTHITAPAPRAFGFKLDQTFEPCFMVFPEIDAFRWWVLNKRPDDFFRLVLDEVLTEFLIAA
jgi:hypothetical protein